VNPSECRAARSLLNWSQDQLARAAEVSPTTIANFETGKSTPQRSTLRAIRQTFEAAGVEFLEGGGVRLKPR
jgi:transcriptional regulator with XRE-family HTH domain